MGKNRNRNQFRELAFELQYTQDPDQVIKEMIDVMNKEPNNKFKMKMLKTIANNITIAGEELDD